MKPIHAKVLKAHCLKFAIEQGLQVLQITDQRFIASDQDSLLDIEYEHLYSQFQQGHEIDDTLMNEMNHIERNAE